MVVHCRVPGAVAQQRKSNCRSIVIGKGHVHDADVRIVHSIGQHRTMMTMSKLRPGVSIAVGHIQRTHRRTRCRAEWALGFVS